MSGASFIHVADVHLDSPLSTLRKIDEATAARLQNASRRALQNVVQVAIENQVCAVVIAGDLFDGPVKDVGAGLWVDSQFKRLARENIAVILIRGNHDALSNARRVIRWSKNVHEMPADAPATVCLEKAGIAFHGQSFGARSEATDLALAYPAPTMGYFNVGVLHTSLAGSPNHDNYAPTSITTLESKGYDYWALGHIHARTEQSQSPHCYIGFSGNTQGRHIREPGAKGCQLVQVVDQRLKSIDFIPTDSLRWHELLVDLAQLDYVGDVEDMVREQASQLQEVAEGRNLALRVRLQGATNLHADLTRPGIVDRLGDSLTGALNEVGEIWLESIQIESRPARVVASADLDLPLKYLSQVTDELRTDSVAREELLGVLEELFRKSRSELTETDYALISEKRQSAELSRLLGMAEDLLVARLVADED
ncbi:MAG: DNA repair exonuclease [Pirellulaceae bacterium]